MQRQRRTDLNEYGVDAMNAKSICRSILIAAALATAAQAGIPEPDAVLYGRVIVDGRLVTADDDVMVIARVEGAPKPVGTYTMGGSATAGDNYVLRIRCESLVDGSAQNEDAALIGQTAVIYVKVGRGVEKRAASFRISERGIAKERNLAVTIGDGTEPGRTLCGAFGMVPLMGMFVGLTLMRTRVRRR